MSSTASSVSLSAKFCPPRASRAWPWTRLYKLLDIAREKRVIWVSACAGAGKSTLISQYLANRDLQTVWYNMDSSDTSVMTFIGNLNEALGQPLPSPQLMTHRFMGDGEANLETFIQNYFEQLFSRLKPGGVIVLDGYKECQQETAFVSLDIVLRYACMALPADNSLIVLSRQPPPPALSTLRVSGAVASISTEDFCLNELETECLIRHLGRSVSHELIRRWLAMTHGWVTGIVLLCESFRTHCATECESSLENLLSTYFREEILSYLSDDEKVLLFQMAQLPSMKSSSVFYVTENTLSNNVLEQLRHNNCFITKTNTAYELYPFFRNFLIKQAYTNLPTSRMNAVHCRAVQLLSNEGRYNDVIELLVQTGRWNELVSRIILYAPIVVKQGQQAILESWLNNLPDHIRTNEPWLGYWTAVCQLSTEPSLALFGFEQCLRQFLARSDAVGVASAWCRLIDTVLQQFTERSYLDSLIPFCNKIAAESNLATLPPELAHEALRSSFIVLYMCRPNDACLLDLETQLRLYIKTTKDTNQVIKTGYHLCNFYSRTGRYAQLRGVSDILFVLAGKAHIDSMSSIMLKTVLGMQYSLIGSETDSTITQLQGAIKQSKALGLATWGTTIIGHAIVALLSRGDESATELLEQMRELLSQSEKTYLPYYFILSAWHAWAKGDIALAQEQIRSAVETCDGLEMSFELGLAHAGSALFMSKDAPGYAFHTEQARRMANEQNSYLIEYLVLIVLLKRDMEYESDEKITESIKRLFAIGVEQGIMNCYFWDPVLMSRICSKAINLGIEVDYANKLIQSRNLVPVKSDEYTSDWPWRIRVYTLGCFRMLIDDKPLEKKSENQAKPLALLQAIITMGGQNVPQHRLVDELWPDSDGDAAHNALKTTLHRLRKQLRDDEAIILQNKRLSINFQRVWVDVFEFKNLLKNSKVIAKPLLAAHLQRLVDLYQGQFFEGEEGSLFAPSREYLHMQFQHAFEELTELYESSDNWEMAAHCYEHGLLVDGARETLRQRLTTAYEQILTRSRKACSQRKSRWITQSRTIHSTQGTAMMFELVPTK